MTFFYLTDTSHEFPLKECQESDQAVLILNVSHLHTKGLNDHNRTIRLTIIIISDFRGHFYDETDSHSYKLIVA